MSGSATTSSGVYEFNGHHYQVVNSQGEWVQNSLSAGTHQEALDAASNMSYNGIQGHLVTITSQEENDFLANNLLTANGSTGLTPDGFQLIPTGSHTGDGWFYTAGSDRDSEGNHIWLAGPEAGEVVASLDLWGTGEPSSYSESHDAIAINGGGQKAPGTYAYQDNGSWFSINDGSQGDWTMSELVAGYIVEYSPAQTPPTTSEVYEFNGHHYQIVRTQTDWIEDTFNGGTHQEALDAASQMTYNGVQGHLVTITSSEENEFFKKYS
jgi:hypothetical protein